MLLRLLLRLLLHRACSCARAGGLAPRELGCVFLGFFFLSFALPSRFLICSAPPRFGLLRCCATRRFLFRVSARFLIHHTLPRFLFRASLRFLMHRTLPRFLLRASSRLFFRARSPTTIKAV